MTATNPLKQILDIRAEERVQALLMSLVAPFQILRPLKNGLFSKFYDQSGSDLLGWQLTASHISRIVSFMTGMYTMGMYTVWREKGEVGFLAQVLYGNF